jgi:hypothetical protein
MTGSHFLPIFTSKAHGKSVESDIDWTDPLVILLSSDDTVHRIQQRNTNYAMHDIVGEIYRFLEQYQPRAVSYKVDDRVLGQMERAINTIDKRLKERYHVLADRVRHHQDNKLYTHQHNPPQVHGIRRNVFDKRTPYVGAQTTSSRVSGSSLDQPWVQSVNLNNYHPGLRHPAMITRDQERVAVQNLNVNKAPQLAHRMSARHQQLWV